MIKFTRYVCIVSFILTFTIAVIPIFVLLLYLLVLILMPFGQIAASTPLYLPAIFLASAIVLTLHLPFRRHRHGFLIASVLTLGLLWTIPIPFNLQIDRHAEAARSGDHDDIVRPFKPKVLAIRRDGSGFRDEPICDGFCKRALLNHAVDGIIIQKVDRNGQAKTASYKFGRSHQCADLVNGDDIHVEGEQRRPDGPSADVLLKLRKVAGECITIDDSSIAVADTIITVHGHKGLDSYEAYLNPAADTLSTERITVEQREGNGYRETFRLTGTSIDRLNPIFAPTFADRHGTPLRIVLSRQHKIENLKSIYFDRLDWNDFVTRILGLDLALNDEEVVTRMRAMITDILRRNGKPTAEERKYTEDFLAYFSKSTPVTDLDRPLVLALLEDRRIPLPWSGWHGVSFAPGAPPDYLQSIADTAFRRLREIAPTDEYNQASALGELINHLPVNEIMKHREDLEWLARQDTLRTTAYPALKRLTDFGAEVAPTLLFLVEDSRRASNDPNSSSSDDRNRRKMFDLGLMGLCKIGPSGADLIQPLYDRIDSGKATFTNGDWELIIATLVSLGAQRDDIWGHIYANKSGPKWSLGEFNNAINQRACNR